MKKNMIWVVLVIGVGLLAVFFLLPDKSRPPEVPATKGSQGFKPGTNFPGGNPLPGNPGPGANGQPTNPGQGTASVNPNFNIDESRMGTPEDQKKLLGQLQLVLKRNDISESDRKQVEQFVAELQRRVGTAK